MPLQDPELTPEEAAARVEAQREFDRQHRSAAETAEAGLRMSAQLDAEKAEIEEEQRRTFLKQKELEEQKGKVDPRQAELAARRATAQTYLPPSFASPEGQSLADRVAHLGGLTWEGAAMTALLYTIGHLLRAAMGTEYMEQEELWKNTPPNLRWEPQPPDGKYPEIYPIHVDAKGNATVLTDEAPIPPEKASRYEIMCNGLVPPPDRAWAYYDEFQKYLATMAEPDPNWKLAQNTLFGGGAAPQLNQAMKAHAENKPDLLSDQMAAGLRK